MADIQFDEEQQYSASRSEVAQKPFLLRLVLSTGLVRTRRGAEYVLIGAILACLVLTVLILIHTGSSAPGLSPADIQRITDLQQGVRPSAPPYGP